MPMRTEYQVRVERLCGQLIGRRGRNQDHRKYEDRADGLERYHHRERHQGQQEEKYAPGRHARGFRHLLIEGDKVEFFRETGQ